MTRQSIGAERHLWELCQEGAARHGDDVSRVAGYVRSRIDDLSAADRASLLDELSLLLGDHGPRRGFFSRH